MSVWHVVKIERVGLREVWDDAQLLNAQVHQDGPNDVYPLRSDKPDPERRAPPGALPQMKRHSDQRTWLPP